MIAKAVTRSNITHSSLLNGFIDRTLYRYPNFDKMLAVCRLDPTESESTQYKLCVDSFPHLFKIYLEKGHCDDEVFESLDFPMDKNKDGTEVFFHI